LNGVELIAAAAKHGKTDLATNIHALLVNFFAHDPDMPKHKQLAGTYKVTAGKAFYVGSTSDLVRRRGNHAYDLKTGNHPCPKLQAAYKGQASCFLVDPIPRLEGETDAEHRGRLRAAEQVLLERFQDHPGLANRSKKACGPDHFSKETRRKMGDAKRGARNAKARPVIVTWPDGRQERFDTATDAAGAIGVSQQLCQLWLAGKVKQPGEGAARRKHAHLWGLRVSYAD
jgi:hypothetical protein